MANLTKQFRSPHSPSPIYGIRPGFNVGDLDRMYSTEIQAIASTSSAVAAPTAVSPKARVIKLTVNVTAGTGTVDISIKSAADTYTATVATYATLALGSHDFYLGGWSSPVGDSVNGTYVATQYGPNVDADSNYIGGPYNPALFLSLDGADIKVYSTVTGTVTYDVSVTPVS